MGNEMNADDDNNNYWPKFVVASIAIAAGTALATEGARVIANKLRERWGLKPKHEESK